MEIFTRNDNIFYVKDLLSQELCHRCIELYESDPRKHPGHTTSAGGAKQLEVEVKVSTDLAVETDGIWAPVFAELHSAVTAVVQGIAAAVYRLQDPALQEEPGTFQMAPRCFRARRVGSAAGRDHLSEFGRGRR